MGLSASEIKNFHQLLMEFYKRSGRHDMAWRQPDAKGRFDPYKILVSEVMLQQTQVVRVTPKYHAFLRQFPSVAALAHAPLSEVVKAWNGLGYNRRAKYLWQTAAQIMDSSGGVFPHSRQELEQLPGIGPNTAGAIVAYVFNQPVIYIETNIRTVIIHHFFRSAETVSDAVIRNVLKEVLTAPQDARVYLEPREFYWAMMDYGSYLKKTVGNLNQASRSYAKQTTFQGSRRQIRGAVIRLLTAGPFSQNELQKIIPDEQLPEVVLALQAEGLIVNEGKKLRLA